MKASIPLKALHLLQKHQRFNIINYICPFVFDSGPTSESDYEMHLLPGEEVHMALNGTKQLERLTLCFWKKSNQSGLKITYPVHANRNDRLKILEEKNSLRFVLMTYKRYELNVLSTVQFTTHSYTCPHTQGMVEWFIKVTSSRTNKRHNCP